MIFKKISDRKILKTNPTYQSIQKELKSYQKLGIEEYIYMGQGCNICSSLNEKTFRINDAKVGINLPPMHPNCRCTIRAKTRIDIFNLREDANPLKDNPKFDEWKKKHGR